MKLKTVAQTRKTKTSEVGFPQTLLLDKHNRFMKNPLSRLRIAETLCYALLGSLLVSIGIEVWMFYHPRTVYVTQGSTCGVDMKKAVESGGLIYE
jgi:hypothetical protein